MAKRFRKLVQSTADLCLLAATKAQALCTTRRLVGVVYFTKGCIHATHAGGIDATAAADFTIAAIHICR